jgi:hypothetical protein
MKKIIIPVALIMAVSISIFGQKNNKSAKTDNDKKAVISIAAELNKAKINLDVSALERIIADDYKEIDPIDGEFTKSRMIAIYKEFQTKPGDRFVSYNPSDMQVRFYDNTAIFTESQTWILKDSSSGKESISYVQFLMVAVKRNGRWQVVFWGDTPEPVAERVGG